MKREIERERERGRERERKEKKEGNEAKTKRVEDSDPVVPMAFSIAFVAANDAR